MGESLVNNKRIAKNTIFLYLRLFITLAVTLYTSRIILQLLGVEDFGIYNTLGGVVVFFSFINSGLRSTFQRFISFEIGKSGKVGSIFSVSIESMLIMAMLFFVFAETVGLWFVYNILNIPEERMYAAEWVYQLSIFTFLASMLQSPYYAAVLSYEKMDLYAYVSIFDVLFKLIIVFLLYLGGIDKLILYSLLIFVVTIINLVILAVYIRIKLDLSFKWQYDDAYFRNIFKYSGWSMLNGCSVVTAYQGGNILLNIFGGVAANAALGIANQASSAIYGFVLNFQGAFQPQIVKLYAAGLKDDLWKLVYRTSLVSYYLLSILFFPLVLNINLILRLWLSQVPEYAANLCILLLIYFLFDALQAPLWILIGATGEMKAYTSLSALINVFNIPISWWLLSLGASIYCVFMVRVGLNFLCCIMRTLCVKHLLSGFSIKNYLHEVIFRIVVVTVITCCILFVLYQLVGGDNVQSILLSFFLCLIIVCLLGFDRDDKQVLINYIKVKLDFC